MFKVSWRIQPLNTDLMESNKTQQNDLMVVAELLGLPRPLTALEVWGEAGSLFGPSGMIQTSAQRNGAKMERQRDPLR